VCIRDNVYDPRAAGCLLFSLPGDKGPSLGADFAVRGLFLRLIGSVEKGSGIVVE